VLRTSFGIDRISKVIIVVVTQEKYFSSQYRQVRGLFPHDADFDYGVAWRRCIDPFMQFVQERKLLSSRVWNGPATLNDSPCDWMTVYGIIDDQQQLLCMYVVIHAVRSASFSPDSHCYPINNSAQA